MTQWKEVNPLDTLATASDFDSAVRYDQQAMQAYNAGPMSQTLQQHLAMFREHRRLTSR